MNQAVPEKNSSTAAATSAVAEGKKAPEFALLDQNGRSVKLSKFKGKTVVLYFYPKDLTPGCTTEAVEFKKKLPEFKALKAEIVGISPDDVASHCNFDLKFQLQFTLLSDPDHSVAEKYGAWGEKVQYGKRTMGIIRSTFIIDPKGVIKKVFPKVKVDGHADEVLAYLRGEE